MFVMTEYCCPETIAEAYELHQKKGSAILGGLLWLKMSGKRIQRGIDLTRLNLDYITEQEDGFHIGAMATLRQCEQHEGLEKQFGGCIRQAVAPIVGVQFRNLATVGGSVFSRFGFSDVASIFLLLDADVVLYPSGRLPLQEFLAKGAPGEILTEVILPKTVKKSCYLTKRLTKTDYPILACGVARGEEGWRIVLGARPMRAMLLENHLPQNPGQEDIQELLSSMEEKMFFGDNMRATAAYRKHLAEVFLKRGIHTIAGGQYENKTLD